MKRLALIQVLVFAVAGLSVGCDRDDSRQSPSVTFSAPPSPQSTSPSTPDDGDEEGLDDTGDITSERHPADLPEGTAEQKEQLMEGRKAFLNRDYQRATEVFEELAFQEPVTEDTISAAVALAQIYIETGRSERALELFADLEEHIAEIPEVLFVLAGVYSELGHPRRAIHAYDRAYTLNRDYIFILPQMAELLVQQGEEEKAGQLLLRYEQRVYEFAEILESPARTSEGDRLYVLDILAMLHDERAHQALQAALEDPSTQIRGSAALALGDLAVSDAEEELRQLAVDDDEPSVRESARLALQKLSGQPPSDPDQ